VWNRAASACRPRARRTFICPYAYSSTVHSADVAATKANALRCQGGSGETRGVERTRIEFRKFIGCPSFPGWGGYDSPSGVSGSFHSLGILEIKPRPYRRLTQLLYSLFGS
jgi:hypothetical protein